MQAYRSCSGVPIPREEVERRDRERQLKRQRTEAVSAADGRDRRSSRLPRSRLAANPEPETNFRSSGTEEEEDLRRRRNGDRLKPHEVAAVAERRQNLPLEVDRLSARHRSPANSDGRPATSVPLAVVEVERDRVDVAGRSASPDRRFRTSDAATAPRRSFTVFTIERLLHG